MLVNINSFLITSFGIDTAKHTKQTIEDANMVFITLKNYHTKAYMLLQYYTQNQKNNSKCHCFHKT